jgi:predicted Zn-dependent protease
MEFRQGHVEEARKRYAQAVQLDSQNFLAHYYFAAISMSSPLTAADEAKVESSLRTAIKLNPSFAPAYDWLAAFLGMHRRNLDEARMMGLTAVSLDPANVGYRINVANVLLAMGQGQNAVRVLSFAVKLAKSPQEVDTVNHLLMNAQEYAGAQERTGELGAEPKADQDQGAAATNIPPLSQRRKFVPSGPHRFVVGVLKAVHCDAPNLDLTVTSGAKTLALHADNYYKIQFTTLNFQPNGDLKPCTDLENRSARVEYVESADKSEAPQLIAVELHR